jgi:ParB-like chromosome segregation protein Spo0J
VIDGHTRLEAAERIGRRFVAVYEREFEDEEAALKYALHNQRDRRNLNDAHILHLVEKLDKMYKMGGDRRSIFATTKLDLFDDNIDANRESSREVTARLIGTTAEKVSQCRHVRDNCTPAEIREIKSRKKTLHAVYKSSLAAKKNEEKKLKKQEITRKRLEELKTQDFPSTMGKDDLHQHIRIAEKLLTIADKLLPNLEKRTSDMCEIESIVKSFKSDDEKFKIFCEQEPIKRFLRSLFVLEFIAMLKCFGYKIATPCSLKLTPEEHDVPAKKKRPVPPPHCNIARIWEPDYVDPRKWDELYTSMARAVERDIEEGTLIID